MKSAKQNLRDSMRAKLAAHSPSDRARRSAVIQKKLFRSEAFRNANTILFFVGLPAEVDTAPMIDAALTMGKRVFVPRTDLAKKEIRFYAIQNRAELVPGAMGILEPKPDAAREVVAAEVDCVIVPGVVFDEAGNRLGRGAGFYDRFLAGLPSRAKKIGIAFVFQVLSEVPSEAHDVRVDALVTD